MAPDFRNAKRTPKKKSHHLNKFISKHLQTDEEFRDLMSKAIDNLNRHLQHNCAYSVNEMIKGGSLGKGTALKGTSDLDCVLVLNDIEDVEELIDNIDDIKKDLCRCLTPYLSSWKIQIECQTRFSVQFTMSYANEFVEVDLLPTFDIKENELTNIYRDMKRSLDIQQYYSAALTEFQRDFVKKLPSRIKDLIRLVKYWCKTFVKQVNESKVVPSSYLLELITIHAWEKAGKPTTINMAIAFKALMEELKNYRRLNVAWNVYYQKNQEMDSPPPRVLDPANPYNNVCARVNCWESVARIAEETMEKPLFRDLTITSHWCRGPPPMPSRRRRRKRKDLQTLSDTVYCPQFRLRDLTKLD